MHAGGRTIALAIAAVVATSGGCARQPPLVSRPATATSTFVIRNVRVFNAPRAQLADGRHDVLVRDGRIADVGPPGLAAPGVSEVDGGGGTLLPGLVDVH